MVARTKDEAVYGRVSQNEEEDSEMADLSNGTKDTTPVAAPATSKDSDKEDKDKPSGSVVIFAVLLYAVCSSTLLVINKVAMHLVPDAPFILFCQFLASALAVKLLKAVSPDMDIEELKWDKTKAFVAATFLFYLCLLSNTQALHYVNVETVIVVRSCSPIAVSLLEHVTLKKPLPSLQGIVALLAIAGGAGIYVIADKGFDVTGYGWLVAYFIFIVSEMVFVKFIVDTVKMSTWTRVYYNNTLSLPMAMISAFAMGESKATTMEWNTSAAMAVALSCVVGVAISYAGFNLRKLVSATSFTVVGVICKLLSVLINDLIWSKHSNAVGHAGLMVCIVAGFMYEKVKKK